MSPTTTAEIKAPHEDFDLKKEISWCLGEEVVISGMSGRFPEADTVEEFKHKLYEGVDMVTENDKRYPSELFGLPKRIGTIKNLSHFDAQNFGINAKMAHEMDPQMRMLVEVTHEAILDAGINPASLKGSRTGVYTACNGSDAYVHWSANEERVHGYGMLGCSLAMVANRISFTFDFKGPSFALDSSCSSSLFALQQALTDIRTGVVDNAVVCGSNLVLLPTKSLSYKKANLLTPPGELSKPLDSSSDGFERSEAVVVCFLQKRKGAKRVYATVLSAAVQSDGYNDQGFNTVRYEGQIDTMTQALTEANVKPEDVEFVETHAMGTQVGDSVEANAIAKVFCKNRKEPLLVGSVKSNMGHAEPAAGLCSLVKVLLAMETGVIAPNIHYDCPNKYVPALINSEIKVVDKPTAYRGGIVAVNSIGLAGTNSTVLLASNPSAKTIPEENKRKFRLICVSGRNNAAVEATLDKILVHKEDEEFLTLVNDIYSKNIPGYDYKGYAVVTDEVVKEVQPAGQVNRPIWYAFAGMGSQWAGMARDLIKIPICEKIFRKLHDILMKTENYNLLSVLLSEDESTFDNVLNSAICINTIQVALVDFLASIGITPDGMIGHSAGELGCAYADGTLTAEEVILVSYYRGRAILGSNLEVGAMAAIGLTWEETKKRAPEGIYAACHNSNDSVTISGPPADIKTFVDQLKSEGVFAREVKSSGFAFHSKYIAKAGPVYRKYLEKVIKNPKLRTPRWISSCYEESEWNTPSAQYSGHDYHVSNLLNPVLFQESFKHIPENAIIIELAPHHLMQAVIKRALGPKVTVLGLVKRLHKNNLVYLLSNIGKFYIEGGQPNLNNLLTTVQYPVSRGTPMIQSTVEWDHSSEWTVPDFSYMALQKTGSCEIVIDLTTEEYSYINGHIVDGRIVLPGVGYVEIAWKVFSRFHGQYYKDFPVILENIKFFRATILPENGSVTLTVSYLAGSKSIEISEGSAIVMRANIRKAKNFDEERLQNLPLIPYDINDTVILTNKADIYKYFVILGFTYYGGFLGMKQFDALGYYSELEFHDQYAPFMDTMIQASIYTLDTRILHLPVGIERVLIDPKAHKSVMDAAPKNADGIPYAPIRYYKEMDVSTCGGIEIRGLNLNLASAKSFTQQPLLEKYVFIPFFASSKPVFNKIGTEQLVKIFTDIVIENNAGAYELKVVEYAYGKNSKNLYGLTISQNIESVPLNKIEAVVTVVTDNPEQVSPSFVQNGIEIINKDDQLDAGYHFIVAENVSDNPETLNTFLEALVPGGFVLTREQLNLKCADKFVKLGFQPVSEVSNDEYRFYFFKKPSLPAAIKYVYINETYKWIDDLKSALNQSKENGLKVIVVGEKQPSLGLLGLFNCLKREPGNINVRCVFVQDTNAPAFSESDPFYVEQLKKDLTVNVYKDSQWGSYRHLTIPSPKDNKINTVYAYADAVQKGDLSTIQWVQDAPPSYKTDEYGKKKLCSVYYAPITENDLKLTSQKGSKYPSHQGITLKAEYIGMEFSGKDENGKRVMGLVGDRALATTVFADPEFLWDVPEEWSLEQACTVPLPYTVAYYALFVCGKIKSTDSILIHEASTSLAQAAIAICVNLGCSIYVTGPELFIIYLKTVYPQLSEDRLIQLNGEAPLDYSIIKRTKGEGVNLILNSNGDQEIRNNFKILKTNGKFLDTRRVEERNLIYENDFMKHNITYHSIYSESFFKPEAEKEVKVKVANLVKEGIANGMVVPSLTTPFTQLEEAISFVNDGNFIGKVVIDIKGEDELEESAESSVGPGKVLALRKSYFNPNKSYIILGGLGGFGIELCLFMLSKYVKHMVLVSRSGVKTPAHKIALNKLKIGGVNVIVSSVDASTYDGAEQLIKEAATLAPVGGIFNLAAVLKDSIFENITADDFELVCKPKIQTTRYLDEASRKLCSQLDYFVTFSSISCGRGNAGQTNYGLANSAMDRICEDRRAAGYPATSIQWGAIGDVGMLLERLLITNDQEAGGILPQRLVSCLTTLEYLIQLPEPVLSTVVLAEKVKTASSVKLQPIDVVASILGIKNVESVNRTATLVELGTDSLTNVEIKQTLERKFGIIVSAQDVLQLTFEKIAQFSTGSS